MHEWFVYFPAGSLTPQIIPVTIADTDALLTFLYLTIGCESIETVRFHSPTDLLICDEEGWFKEKPEVNLVGTALYGGTIVGGVVIAQEGSRNGEPDIVGYPDLLQATAAAGAAKAVAEMKYKHLLYP